MDYGKTVSSTNISFLSDQVISRTKHEINIGIISGPLVLLSYVCLLLCKGDFGKCDNLRAFVKKCCEKTHSKEIDC